MMDITPIVDILFDPTEATIEFAARALHNKMESLDPGLYESTWIDLSDRDRDFYRQSVKAVLKAVADVYTEAFPKIAS